jgi:hypothetical protein
MAGDFGGVVPPLLNLNDPRVMSTAEAAEKWGVSTSRIRQREKEFPLGTLRKFGKQWVVLDVGMYYVFGDKEGH